MIMKKYFSFFLTFVIAAIFTSHATAQDRKRSEWTLTTGLGISIFSPDIAGFSQATEIAYHIKSFAFGFGFHHSFMQTPSPFHTLIGIDFDNSAGINSAKKQENIENIHYKSQSAHDVVGLLSVGFNPLYYIKGNNKHALTIAAFGGFGVNSRSVISITKYEAKKIYGSIVRLPFWSVGTRLSYEYRINQSLGVGAVIGYEFPQHTFSAMANFVFHI